MSLWIKTSTKNYDWHIGESLPIKSDDIQQQLDIELIQADGHELEYIYTKIDNIPIPNNRVSRWFGDIAKTIYSNL